MELKWLEDLLVLLDEKSISRAALRRHVTQPAYSRRIRQLEQWLGVELVDRSTKPISIRTSAEDLETGVRDLVNRFYALRNSAHETRDRVTFIAQHTLAISRFPALVRMIKQELPDSSYRVIPADYEECEALFYAEADLLLCYQTAQRGFDFSHFGVNRINLGSDRLVPVASKRLAEQLGELQPDMAIPLLLYQRGGFLAELVGGTCMPAVMRDYRVESICESAFSASLKEMVQADMGIAWLASEIIQPEIDRGNFVSFVDQLGEVSLEVELFYKNEGRAKRVGDLIVEMGRLS